MNETKMSKEELERMSNLMKAMNKVANEISNPASENKGTSNYYYEGNVGNKYVCFTKAKTGYNGKWGFWSWIQTKYKKGITKRTKFAKSGTKAKCEARAKRLLKQLEEKKEGGK